VEKKSMALARNNATFFVELFEKRREKERKVQMINKA
jgi:hypothetical protein